MDIDELRAVQNRERATDSLQELRESFYEDVASYVGDLKERRERAAAEADDPFGSEEVSRLTDEIETAEEVAEAIYERRVGKIVKQASLAAAGMGGDVDGLTSEERKLYDDLVDRITENKDRVLAVLDGESAPTDATETTEERADPTPEPSESTPEPPEPPTEERDVEEPTPAADATGGSSDETDDDRTTLRITDDVGEILGVDDRVYDLTAEDVVTLPEENAEPLVEREAAERL